MALFNTIAATIVDSVVSNPASVEIAPYGIYQLEGLGVLIARTIISGSQTGVLLLGHTTHSKSVLERSVIRGSGTAGVLVRFGSAAHVSGSMLNNNRIGILNEGVVETRGDNTMSGNGTEVSGNALVPFAPM